MRQYIHEAVHRFINLYHKTNIYIHTRMCNTHTTCSHVHTHTYKHTHSDTHTHTEALLRWTRYRYLHRSELSRKWRYTDVIVREENKVLLRVILEQSCILLKEALVVQRGDRFHIRGRVSSSSSPSAADG